MLIYIILYSILLISSIFEFLSKRSQTKRCIVITFVLVFTLFRGLRWKIGTDWQQYYEIFNYSTWNNIFTYERGAGYGGIMEFGYMFLNIATKSIIDDYSFFLLVFNFIILYLYYKFSFKNSPYPILTFIAIIFCSNFFPVRQNLAIAIILWGYTFIIQRKLFLWCIAVFLASSVHTSAIIAFPIYWIGKIRLNILYITAIYFSVSIISHYIADIFNFIINYVPSFMSATLLRITVYSEYVREDEFGLARNIISSLFNYVLLIIFYFLFVYKKHNATSYNTYINLFLLYCVISNLFASSMTEFGRIANYFIYAYSFLLAQLWGKYGKDGIKGKIISITLIAYMYYKFSNTLLYYPELMFPYRSIFN